MALMTRCLIIGICTGWLALLVSFPVFGQVAAERREVGDLVCPNASAVRKHLPEHTSDSQNTASAEMPSDAELGTLARTVIQPPLTFETSTIAGLIPKAGARRIAFWGDSHLAGGPLASTLIQALRDQGLRVASGLLPPTMGRANVRLPELRAYCIGSGWTSEIAYTAQSPRDTGPALVDRAADAGPNSYLWLDLRDIARRPDVRQVQLIYRTSSGASVRYTIDDGAPQTSTLPATAASRALALSSSQLLSTLKLSVSAGKFTLLGIVLDRGQQPDVTMDVFGLPSATVKGWANANPKSLAQALHGITYDGVVLEYGTNEGADPDFDIEKYTAMLTRALDNLRQVFPDASCVLVGPPDRGVLRQGSNKSLPLLNYANIHQKISQTQFEVGQRFGCMAWNWQSLMGGPGGSYGWAHAQPRLMGRDLTHLSPSGYRLTGQALAHSLRWTP
ncbi:MAG TPA: hypothetical protein VIM98_03845 [Dyella sp.]|uniref:hypothetical protein n=1 Tax=Dyella sp. TaxID=1869338 RepID=UPI002F94B608